MGGRGAHSHSTTSQRMTVEELLNAHAAKSYEAGKNQDFSAGQKHWEDELGGSAIEYQIPQWKLATLSPREQLIWDNSTEDAYIKKETEKAVLVVKPNEDYGEKVSMWVPKSILLTPEKRKELYAKDKDHITRRTKNYNIGKAYNNYLYRQAKEKGVKGIRERMKTDNLKSKLEKAGYTPPTLDEYKKMPTTTNTIDASKIDGLTLPKN